MLVVCCPVQLVFIQYADYFANFYPNFLVIAGIFKRKISDECRNFHRLQYKQAKQYLERAKENKVYESDAHYYLGHIAYQLEDFDEAASQFSYISNDITNKSIQEDFTVS